MKRRTPRTPHSWISGIRRGHWPAHMAWRSTCGGP